LATTRGLFAPAFIAMAVRKRADALELSEKLAI
jgi:hypothetical protein